MDLLRKAETESRYFNCILLQLVKYGLISEIDRRKIVFSDQIGERQAAIFQIILEKPLSQFSIILEVLHYFHHNGYSNMDISSIKDLDAKIKLCTINSIDPSIKETNPLLNNTIINNTFQFLTLQDILTCRAVCSQWNDVAESIIRKRAKIKLDDLKPDAFVRMFADHLPNHPFSAFSFTEKAGKVYQSENTHFVKPLVDFFKSWGKNIKELSWSSVNLDSQGKSWNISYLTTACQNLSYLNIQRENSNTSLVHVSWKSLIGIKTLILRNCAVRIDEETKLSPSKIQLENIKVLHNNKRLEKVRLNDILNFSGIKEMTLKYIGLPDSAETRQILVFTDETLNIDLLNLDTIYIENWNEGENWKVDTLHLKNISFTRKLQIQYNELVVDTNALDFLSLHENIQKLRIIGCNKTKFICSQPANLPKLKHLRVDFAQNISRIFSDFMGCLNLDDVSFDGTELNVKVDIDSIPESVKALKLGKGVRLDGEKQLILDKLILDEFSLLTSEEILSKIKTKTLVLQWVQNYENNDSIILFLKRHNFLNRVVVGEFNWDNWNFENCHLSKKVNTQSKYYEFKYTFGASISFAMFKEEMKLYTRAS